MFAFDNNPLTNGPVFMIAVIIMITVIMVGIGAYYAITDYLNGSLNDDDMRVCSKDELYMDMARIMQGEV